MNSAHMRTLEALALGRPIGPWADADVPLPPTSHLARRLYEQGTLCKSQIFVDAITTTTTGIAATRITWQTVGVQHAQPLPEDDAPFDLFNTDTALDVSLDDASDRLVLQVDDDMEGIAMRAAHRATPSAADVATPIMVGIPIAEWPRPAMLPNDIVDQELAASSQVVPGGAGSVLVANPFFAQEAPAEEAAVSTLPALWRSIHSAWHGGAVPHWWNAGEDSSMGWDATEDDVPVDVVPSTTVVRQLDGMDAPSSMDAAAIARMADWERFEEPWYPEQQQQQPPSESDSVAGVVSAWLLGDREPLSLLLRADAAALGRRGRRLMSVNWPLTGTGIGLALVGIILMSGASTNGGGGFLQFM